MLSSRDAIPPLLGLGASVTAQISSYETNNASPSQWSESNTTTGSAWQWSEYNTTDGSAWQWGGPWQGESGYWFDEFEGVLSTMQHTYWNGTYWPTTLQWIGAFIDTLLAASEISFTNALIEDNGNVPGAQTSLSAIQAEIQEYYEQIEAYYGGEDTIQIFGAAYDDAQWVVLEWLEAIRFINEYDAYASSSLGQADISRFAHRAHVFYNIVQDQFNTSLCGGGLTWNPTLAVYKNAITNELFIDSSIWMYLYWPGDDNNTDPYPSPKYINATNNTLPSLPTLAVHDPLLLQNAKAEYAWFKSQPFADSQGLIIDGFHISDNQTTCDEPDMMVYTYNQGVLLSGLRGLWEATGDSSYLTDGYDYVEAVINATGWNSRSRSEASQWAGLGRNGIMEDYCDAPANCSQDNQVFKGIYFHHLDLFCEPLPTTTPLVPDLTYTASSALAAQHANTCDGYTQWIEHNAYAALSTRNDSGIIGGWWGAPYVNKTQDAAPEYSVSTPYGSQDIRNNPELLNQSPWVCNGWYCDSYGNGKYAPTYGVGRRMAEVMRRKRMDGKMARRDVNDEGRGRTAETEAAGLGVVKAASDFTMKRPSS